MTGRHEAGGAPRGDASRSGAHLVTTLLGHRQMAFAPRCLRSLLRCSATPLRLRALDDGTLAAADVAELGDLGVEVLVRADADARVEPLLAAYPRCLAYRRDHVLGRKLFDVALLDAAGVRYCDADVLFLRPFRGLFEGPAEPPIFMRDIDNAYSVRPWTRAGRGVKLLARINTGVIAAPRALLDLERAEWFLGRPDLRPEVWIEQTCWATLAAAGARWLDPRQFAIPVASWRPCGEEIALHFVGSVRERLAEPWERLAEGDATAVTEVRAAPASPLSPRAHALSLLRRRAVRIAGGRRAG